VIAGTQTVILQVYANVSAVTAFAATDPVPTPIISSREVLTSVHVGEGKTTVIGGLVSRSTLRIETKFPILGDIPILGYLFRSTSEKTERTTLQFHITPRIIQGPRGFQDGAVGG
jgi:type II secretory pathway component GspD/PulD (secretin)